MTNGKVNYTGFIDDAFNFACENGLLNPELWARFVQQFRENSDYASAGKLWTDESKMAVWMLTN